MPETPDTLPTCWYCPECPWRGRAEYAHSRTPGSGIPEDCPGTPIEASIVPPDALRSTAGLREVLGLLGLNTREALVSPRKTFVCFRDGRSDPKDWTAALVVLPSGPATKENNDG